MRFRALQFPASIAYVMLHMHGTFTVSKERQQLYKTLDVELELPVSLHVYRYRLFIVAVPGGARDKGSK